MTDAEKGDSAPWRDDAWIRDVVTRALMESAEDPPAAPLITSDGSDAPSAAQGLGATPLRIEPLQTPALDRLTRTGGVDTETPTEPAVEHVPSEPVGEYVPSEPVVEYVPSEPVGEPIETAPVPEPVAMEPEPEVIAPEPVAMEPEPEVIAPEPEPEVVEPEVIAPEPEPEVVEPEPLPETFEVEPEVEPVLEVELPQGTESPDDPLAELSDDALAASSSDPTWSNFFEADETDTDSTRIPEPDAPSSTREAPARPRPNVAAAASATAVVERSAPTVEQFKTTDQVRGDGSAPGAGANGAVAGDQVMAESAANTAGFRASDFRTILEWLAVVGSALLVALLIKTFVLQAFWIPSESMETTINENDRILVNKLSYRLHDVRRGDLVVFQKLDGFPGDTDDIIKRAIGLPGETIEVRSDGRIWIWGPGETPDDALLLNEPYLDPQNALFRPPSGSDPVSSDIWNERCLNQRTPGRCTLGPDSFFMLGDNRQRSSDSRFFGPVPEDNIVGRAFLRIWPLGEISTL